MNGQPMTKTGFSLSRPRRKPFPALLGALALLATACGEEQSSRPAAPKDGQTTRDELSAEDLELAVWEPATPPNVILILVDTLRADAVLDPKGLFDTPNLDRLGAEGLVFQSVFAHAPMTLPSHSSLFSSRPPLVHGVKNNWQDVPDDLPLLAEWMEDHGYQTRAVISLGTLNPPPKQAGLSRGFQAYDIDYWSIGRAEDTATRLEKALQERSRKPLFLFAHFADPHEPYNAHGDMEKWADMKVDGVQHRRVKTSVMSQIEEEIDLGPGEHEIAMTADHLFRIRSFDAYVGDEPIEVTWVDSEVMKRQKEHHLKVTVPASDEHPRVRLRYWVNDVPHGKSKALRYSQEVNYVDQGIGRFLDDLRAAGLYDDSLILFTSDHGETLGERGPNGGFYGHVEYLTDEEIHVPFLVKLPAGDPRGPLLARSLDRQVSHVDVTPTVLDLVGLPPLPGQTGTSLLSPHTSTHIAETYRPEAKKSQIALRDEHYKMIYDIDEDSFVMYDLTSDPGETTDVFAAAERERPDWAARLQVLGSGGTLTPGEEDSARRAELEKLGYGGDTD